jgi:serine/threonine protein kinase
MIHVIFPFKNASSSDKFYMLLLDDPDTYWETVSSQNLTPELKDLVTKMLRPNGEDRPTMEEISKHPWMTLDSKDGYHHEYVREQLIDLYLTDKKISDQSPLQISKVPGSESGLTDSAEKIAEPANSA